MASATYLWSRILSIMSNKHSEALVRTWFDDVDVVELNDSKLVLSTPNEFTKPYLETKVSEYIKDALKEMNENSLQIVFLNAEELSSYRSASIKSQTLDAINEEYTFDNFVVGSSNQFAHAAAHAVATMPSSAYNPLLIYGASGLGKTHLLYAIANYIHQTHPDFNIVYVKGDQFTNELIAALKEGNNIEFRNKYRTADLFLMDDIQFIAGKDSTQEEFFHTFNTLFEQKKQIVLTSDRPPEEMNRLEERLKTRFQWGLLADIKPPDYETRIAIIQKKADSIGLELPDDVVSYIAENITSNVRHLEGTVNKIKAYHDMMTNFDITLPNVSRAIKDMYLITDPNKSVLPTPQLIISEVSSYYNISEHTIRGTTRDKNTTEARQISMYLIRKLTNLSLEDIAAEYGKDHTTVMHSISKIEGKLQSDSRMEQTIKDITSNINGNI